MKQFNMDGDCHSNDVSSSQTLNTEKIGVDFEFSLTSFSHDLCHFFYCFLCTLQP